MMYLLHFFLLLSFPLELSSFSECVLSNTLWPQLKKLIGRRFPKVPIALCTFPHILTFSAGYLDKCTAKV